MITGRFKGGGGDSPPSEVLLKKIHGWKMLTLTTSIAEGKLAYRGQTSGNWDFKLLLENDKSNYGHLLQQ